DRDHQHVLAWLEAGLLHGLDRTELHVVVMSERGADALEIVGRLDEGFHHLLAALRREITALRLDDLHVGEAGDDRLEALLAFDRRRRTGRSLLLDDVAAALARRSEPGAG